MTSVSKVSSTEIDLVSRSGSTGRSSRAYASSTSAWRVRPADDLGQLVGRDALQVGDGADADPLQLLRGHRPDPGNHADGHRRQQRHLGARLDDPQPSGLASSLATLAMNLEVPTPTDAVSPPVAAVTAALSSATRAVTRAG